MAKAHLTVMAFDFGLRQIGVATGNNLLHTTQPLPILQAKDGQPDWRLLEKMVLEWRPDLLVVGEPLNMDGTDSELAALARKSLTGSKITPVMQLDLQPNIVGRIREADSFLLGDQFLPIGFDQRLIERLHTEFS